MIRCPACGKQIEVIIREGERSYSYTDEARWNPSTNGYIVDEEVSTNDHGGGSDGWRCPYCREDVEEEVASAETALWRNKKTDKTVTSAGWPEGTYDPETWEWQGTVFVFTDEEVMEQEL